MAAKVKVAARLRPFINSEIRDNTVVVLPAERTISVTSPRNANERFKFSFMSCYDQSSSQEEIFEKDVRPLIDHVLSGLVCTVFAYGVTSSGKTHTIQGNSSDPGIIPRVVKVLVEQKQQNPHHISLAFSYMEIYKDDVYDLLVPRETAPKLLIREEPGGRIVVANLSEKAISSFEEFDKVFTVACKSRSTGATNFNHASSRSHAVLGICVSKFDFVQQKILSGKINLVDLAGSENNKLTGNDPARMAESAAINKSLTVLGQVVHALNINAARIPYRDSKLTRILQDALGGSSVGLLICNLAPGNKFRQDTLNTLNFASRTKEIENKPVVNEKEMHTTTKFASEFVAPLKASRPPLIPRAIQGSSRLSVGGPTFQSLGGFGFSGTTRNSLGGPRLSTNSAIEPAESIQIDIDEKISRAVQQEVERRLAERENQERERLAELERLEQERLQGLEQERAKELEEEDQKRASLMKKHEDLNKLLKKTLRKAEKENSQRLVESDLEKVTSPKKSKKLARAYVSLGRDYLRSKEPDYNGALKLWMQAATYIPENKALAKRIMELQVAIREGVSYRIGKRHRNSTSPKLAADSPGSKSPSGSRDHKEGGKLRRRARLALARERGELDLATVRTPSPRKAKGKKDVFLHDSSEDDLLVENN